MITQIRARVARWIQPRPQPAGDSEVALLADRIEGGDLGPSERVELAELVVMAAAAVTAIQERPVGMNAAIWAAGTWEPVWQQVTQLLQVAGHRGAEQ